ncbi:MAG: tRNA epoxyqueuosine(34) reductase QueG [Gammaproteobacteria bacterium]|nr:tRNA epoxyqueuosine(34) reductase QueG [Gammaproteobacteria bacterium]
MDLPQLAAQIRSWGAELGFQQIGVAGIALHDAEARLDEWVARGLHGELDYMTRHGRKRTRPGDLVPGTARVISARMDYLPDAAALAAAVLQDGERAYIARYALGRDYHKLLRQRLKHLAERIRAAGAPHGYRVFVDSGPVLEKPLAAAAGLGWQGKHTNLINRQAGSWFLLGEIYTDLPLPLDEPVSDHCGSCQACLDVCPTGAIIAPYLLDARRCISYFTIEARGPIPVEFRRSMGNRIFGCDDCQLVCPWNRYARPTREPDFSPRHGLDAPQLTDLFGWSEAEWSARTAGSALRRPGYDGWLRNIAVALGNAPSSPGVMEALGSRAGHASELVREHVAWALEQHAARRNGP